MKMSTGHKSTPDKREAFDALRNTDDLDMMALKRAYWEKFRFEPAPGPAVRVINESWGQKSDEHSHTVQVGGNIPSTCTCSSYKYRSSPCKHLVAVALDENAIGMAGRQ